ncbi:MAG: 5-(carboxyamino)imidazole ribonucleotide synthase [Bacteroidetes bacterium]|nr:5-(carboxyamino)imidazole ribonucleotide synthase [Bacteroidota bacterium]
MNQIMERLKVGVLGGGQLGSMLIRHAIDFGLNIAVLDKHADSPCARYTSSFCIGDPMNYDDVLAFGKNLDVITIEKEAVNTKALKALVQQGKKVFPSPDIIEIIQNKNTQKKFLESAEIPVVPAVTINGREDLRRYLNKLPGCLKKCENGYDGKGVMIIKNEQDIDIAFEEPSILEELVDIKNEISVIVTRNEEGVVHCYDPVMMIFDKERMILDYQISPANISEEQASDAIDIAVKTAKALNLVGILAVEMFLTNDGKLLVNELAPRPHNSGHHTIEACVTSQYEQLLRVVTGLPLGDTRMKNSSVMINLLEPSALRKKNVELALKEVLYSNDVHLHWYGKTGGHEGRKMGHITITGSTIDNAFSKAKTIRNILNMEYEES